MKPTPLALLFFLLAATSSAVAAQERIVNYDVRMSLNAEGYLSVEEAITVDVRGEVVEHYLYRSLTRELQLPGGDTHEIAYRGNSVRVERLDDHGTGTTVYRSYEHDEVIDRAFLPPRMYAGQRGVDLQPGRYVFHFDYRVTAPFRDADSKARLYWPVTGRAGWALDIESVHVRFEPPPALSTEVIEVTTYDRRAAESGVPLEIDSATIQRDGSKAVTITYEEDIDAGGEFAFSAQWPSGVVEASTIPIDYESVGMLILGILVLVIFGSGAFYLIFFILPDYIGDGTGGGPGAGGGGAGGGAGGGGGGGG